MMSNWIRRLLMVATLTAAGTVSAFDHDYADLGRALEAHVHWVANGHTSVVDYAGLKRDRAPLAAALAAFSGVTPAAFERWTRDQQMAFLINAYNGFTLELILRKYPDLKSIRDLGTLLRSPWKQPFFDLLGARRTLDWIEHETLRPRYGDARIHFAVNCASVGCPALRTEPFTAAMLDAQLDDQQRRFLTDRTRNRYNAADGVLYLSQIFRWYGDDFTGPQQTLQDWLIAQAALLTDNAADAESLRRGTFRIEHLSYDWTLNGPRAAR